MTSKPAQPTDPSHETGLGRVALWLDVEDLRWLSSNCACADSTPDEIKERCGRIRFRANAALHKAGLKGLSDNGAET